MKYNFDNIINRKNTNSLKYDGLYNIFGKENLLPLWVADMDFRTCPRIIHKLNQIIKHGIMGYNIISNNFYKSIINWQKNRHNYFIETNEIFFTTGVVPSIYYLIEAFSEKNDGVLIQTPVYYPFIKIVKQAKRKLLINKLIESNNTYSIDFDDFEKKIAESKIFLLCNPHNPVSRVWKKDELLKMAEICLENKVIIISDEIHSDIVFDKHKHIPIATLSNDIRNMTITCNSASKTFNLASLKTAYLIIHSEDLRHRFKKYSQQNIIETPVNLGLEAMSIAYDCCEDWLEELLNYIYENYLFLISFLEKEIPFLKCSPLEGTYLAWLDFRQTGLKNEFIKKHIIEKAGLALIDGSIFGAGGEGFQRINIACPRSILQKALFMLKNSFINN